MIALEYHSTSHVIIDGPELNIIREHFSVKNEAVHFQRRFGRFVPPRTYVITNQGKVEIGLLEEIILFCESKDIQFTIEDKIEGYKIFLILSSYLQLKIRLKISYILL